MMGLPYVTVTSSSSSSSSSIIISNTNTISNNTTDIMLFGCIGSFETVACVRNAVLSFLAVITALLCIIKVVRLHMLRHQACHQYIIFYCASLESVIGGVHWVLGSISQLDFVLQWLKLVQFLVMCHYYWTLATRALRRERFAKRFLLPFLLLVCAYFTVIATLGIINVQSTWVECLQPYWLELSAAEFTVVQLFAVAGFYITRRLNEISMLDSVRWAQKRDLWCIIIVFEISALVGFLYDITLIIVGDENKGCSSIFLYTQELYSPIFVVFMVIKLLVPIWVMLFVFQPTPPAADQEDLLPAFSDDGTYTSVFSDDQHYRQLYHPTEDYRSTEDSSPSPTAAIQTSINASSVRRNTSNLDPIKEESVEKSSVSTSQSSETKTKFYI
ncbi:uncharacterized protein LOC121370558 [Gigantopelta aegis]|uniref:uncharacterized protein LOC121370558 n=1 Tax=Gigantopelta aegis TaxID=1735272 RepID=UPI001B887424|nr:uncharacterized protein LOC121370558 [Gigantopelta aegis]